LIDGKPVISGKATPDVGYVIPSAIRCFPWRSVADKSVLACSSPAFPTPNEGNASPPASRRQACGDSNRPIPRRFRAACVQRAALMRTLVVEPQVLLMDEPFGALDTHTKIDMHEVLLRIWDREQQTVYL